MIGDKTDSVTEDPGSAPGAEIEQEIREARKFSMEEAMARMAGPGAMSGASPVSEVQQAETEIGTWLRGHLADGSGALKIVVHRHLRGSKALLDNLDQPLEAVAAYCQRVLASDELLRELVREADVEWGRAMDERPLLDRENSPSHPDDPYTAESVKAALRGALDELGRS